MRIVEFVVLLADTVRKRHRHRSQKGRVEHFVVQLEVHAGDQWKPVIRYDCSHGFSHVDRFDRSGKRSKESLGLSFDSALTYGDQDLNKNWKTYVEEFLKEGEHQ